MKHLKSKKEIANGKSGYTLLFAVLTAALVLGVAAFILEMSTKQYELSASARDSMYSYYAADSGIECVALGAFVYPNSTSTLSNPPASITCGKSSLVLIHWNTEETATSPFANVSGPWYDITFGLDFGQGTSFTAADTCAVILADEYYTTDGVYHDFVQSRGYNHCVDTNGVIGPDTSNPNTVERALQLSHTTGS